MSQHRRVQVVAFWVGIGAVLTLWAPLKADTVVYASDDPDGAMAVGTRPPATGQVEIEAGDDFILDSETLITSATFKGLIPTAAGVGDVAQVVVEIYRVFPNDSDANRTPRVPTRVNSPGDQAFDQRDSALSELTFSVSIVGSFSAANSVLNGINPSPNQTTGGEGAVSGQEVLITVQFATPFDLPADHYFFVPQVQLNTGQFLWLSAPRPTVAPGTPISPDLQAWIRNADLDPDWLRIGTDIVGGATAPTFNMTFSVFGYVVQAPPSGTNACGVGVCGPGGLTSIPLSLLGLTLMRLRCVGRGSVRFRRG